MILILTQCFPSRLGGIENLMSNLALGLAKNHEVIVFADQHHIKNDFDFDKSNKDSFSVIRISGFKFIRRRKKIKKIKPLIESNKVKLVIADTWKSIELGITYLNKNKIPVICLAHGNEFLSTNYNKKTRIKTTLDKVNAVVANSNFTENIVKKIINTKVNLKTIFPGATDITDLQQSKISGITGEPVILTLGRLEKRKGHIKVIECIEKLKFQFPNIQYIIAGIGPELKKLKKTVLKKKLEKNITFVGKVNDYEKKYLFKKTNLMIMPTLDETENRSIEGFGIVYIEAAFFSIPSIASNNGGTPEAVIHNQTGKILNNIDDLFVTIRELLLDKKTILRLGQNAQKRAISEFKWNYISKKYLSLIGDISKNN